MSEPLKRYTFSQVAKRECAKCTTTITTTRQDSYILAADVDARLAEVEKERDEWRKQAGIQLVGLTAMAKRAEAAEARGMSCLVECEKYANQVMAGKALIARLVESLTFASTATERTQAWMRKNGVVFKKEGGHWEGVAFSVYTDLVEVAEQARAILDDVKEAGG